MSSSPNGEDTTPSSPYQLPPYVPGSPQVPPAPIASHVASHVASPTASPFVAPGAAPVGPDASGGQPYPGTTAVDASPLPDAYASFPGAPASFPGAPASFPGASVPPGHDQREYRPGTNGLAIAALCCGIAGLLPIAAVVGIVLGIVALKQLRRVVQGGRGLAIAGIVLGSLWLLGWAALITIGVLADDPASSTRGSTASSVSSSSSPSGPVERRVEVGDLKAGDCFNGGSLGSGTDVGDVSVVPCSTPHTSQVITVFELPRGRYPGEDKVVDAADKGCSDKADPLVRESRMHEVDPSFLYPADAWTWSNSRAIQCTADAKSGTVTGSVLK
ncbi:DUF4190 domain-containing protein [Intrasporangium sp. YIM S08009]|uniref:DUF4190 domain-containing protein n=1 Tax=Intrasporangium zincisolvens TaxID=3080018 RepID=UPI002B05AAEF|nr:DUF4190 domain-containing protein [Intrasporangium sp. YIM S08009]